MSCSGISWAICKSASRSRQITTPAPHHSSFTGRMPFLPPNQQHQSTEGLNTWSGNDIVTIAKELHVAWCYSTNNSPFLPSYIVFITGTNWFIENRQIIDWHFVCCIYISQSVKCTREAMPVWQIHTLSEQHRVCVVGVLYKWSRLCKLQYVSTASMH